MIAKASLITIASLVLLGCGGSSGGPSGGSVSDACTELENDTFNCTQMLTDMVEHAVRPVVSNFATNAQALHDTTDAYCAAQEDDKLTLAKTAWQTTMVDVEQLSVMQFGPLDSDGETGLASFYAYGATVSSCLVDLQVVAGEVSTDNRSGLFALEYLLFGTIGTVSCSKDQSESVVEWAESKTEAEIQTARCDYAKLVADDLVTKSTNLKTAWDSYSLVGAKDTLQVAASLVTDAMFYADKNTKDEKIKALLPQAEADNFNADKVESEFAHQSKEHIIENLIGLRTMFTANGHMGLDDYLNAAGQSAVAADMLTTLGAAITNAESIDDSIFDALETASNKQTCIVLAASGAYDANSSDIDTLCALQWNLKLFTDILKGDFILLTEFNTPKGSGGEND